MTQIRKIILGVLVLVGVALGSQLHAAGWAPVKPPVTATWYGIAAWDENNVVVVGESEGGVIYKTINGGTSWSSKISQVNPAVFDVARVPGTFAAYAVGRHATDSAYMLYAANKGTGWEILSPTGISTFADLYGVSFVSQTTGWVVGSSGLIYKTTDASNWTPQTSGVGTTLRDVDFVDANNGWAVGDSNVVVRTTNGGATWTSVSPGVSANLYGVDFVNATMGWVVGSNGIILYTTNGGATWTVKSPEEAGAGVTFRSVAAFDSSRATFVGSNGTVFVTSDGGTTIVKDNLVSTPYLYAVAYMNSADRWVAGQDVIERYDFTVPAVGVVGTTTATAGTAASFSASASDTQSGIASCRLYVDGVDKAAMTLGLNNTTTSYTFAAAGNFSVYARCLDGAGNAGLGSPITVTVAAAPTQAAPDTTPSVGQSELTFLTSPLVTANNSDIVNIRATIRNAAGVPLSGKNVTVQSSRNDTIVVLNGVTDNLGYAFFVVRSGIVGTSVYSAVVNGVTVGNSVSVTYATPVAPAPDTTPYASQSVLSFIGSGTVIANFSDNVIIRATVRNSAGNPLVGKMVTLSSSRSVDDIRGVTTYTDDQGIKTFVVRSGTAGVSAYSATVEGVSIPNSIVITYTAVASPSTSGSSSSSSSSVSSTPSSSSSSGINPFTAGATTLYPGDLIRGTVRSPFGGYPVFYVTADRKKSLFPNEVTYKTWYADFGAVKVLTQTDLEAISYADKNVTVRPGTSTVRFESDSKLYVVEPGAVIRVIDTAIGNAIYGANFPIMFIEVAFRANYTSGTPVSPSTQFNRTAALDAAPTIAVNMSR